MKNYAVTLRFQFPAHCERGGYRYEVCGKTKADAIKRVRRQAEIDGHCGPWVKEKGRITFTVIEID